MTISDAKPEELRYSSSASNDSKELTPEFFGHVVAYAWLVFGKREHGVPQEVDMFDFLLWEDPDAIPPRIREMLHIEHRVDRRYLKEWTRLVIGAQFAYAFGRLTPNMPVSQLDVTQATFLLRRYQLEFPEEVTWVCSTINHLSRRQRAA